MINEAIHTTGTEVPSKHNKHDQMFDAFMDLNNAIDSLAEFLARIDGQGIDNSPKVDRPQVSLVEVLTQMPNDLHQRADEIRRIVHELDDRLF